MVMVTVMIVVVAHQCRFIAYDQLTTLAGLLMRKAIRVLGQVYMGNLHLLLNMAVCLRLL